MLIDGLTLTSGSEILNAQVESGAAFPNSPIQGRMYYLTTEYLGNDVGLYVFDGTRWVTGDITKITAGTGLTGSGSYGDITLALATSGVTAGSYGSSSAIPVITVDTTGRITAASTSIVDIPSGNITLSGDISGTGVTGDTLNTTLSTTGVSAGTYKSVTVDTKGRVTAGTNPTTLAGYGITDAQAIDADLTAIAALVGTSGFLKKTAADTWSLDTNTYLTSNQSITVSGDATGSGTTTISLALADSGVTAGTYKSVTVDAKGRVSAGTNPTTLSGYGITDAVNVSVLGAASGVATLDSNGLVNTSQLPSYVDDVLEYTNLAGFPVSGSTGKIYVAQDTGKIYRWSGSAYIEISASAGTADQASQLATARSISATGDATWIVSFDGSANVTAALTLADSGATAGTYKSVTVDAKGRVTAGTNPTTLAGYGITDAQALDADLTAIAALAGTSGFLKKTAADTWSLDTNTYLTGNQSITVSGDASGSGTTAISLTLANSGVTAGTYNNSATQTQSFTVDAKGRITTTGTATTITPAWSSITSKPTTISGYGITDAYTKTEVDGLVTGLDFKSSVRVASTANIATLSGLLTIDGITVTTGDRVLVKDQTTGSQNGIYVAALGAWSRSTDADSSAEVTAGMYVFVSEGTANGDSGWVLTTNDTITLDTTSLTFTQFNGLGQVVAGAGLTKTGSQIDVVGTAGRIVANADSIDLATVTQSTGSSFVKVTLDSYGRVSGNTAVSGTDLNSAYGSQTANYVLAAPNGSAGNPTFRLLVAADIPSLDASKITTGTLTGNVGVTAGSASSSFIKYNGTTKTAGQWDGGTTAPSSTTRLNYDGYLYATKFYGDGSALTGISATGTTTATANTLVQRDANADIYANNFISSSDAKLKENVQPINDALYLVNQLVGHKYTLIETQTEHFGFIAQEVEQVLPTLVHENEGNKAVSYIEVISILVEAVKDLTTRLTQLEQYK